MCCDGWNLGAPDIEDGEKEAECPDCGEECILLPNGEYRAVTGCNYSPVCCSTCGCAPCDDSC